MVVERRLSNIDLKINCFQSIIFHHISLSLSLSLSICFAHTHKSKTDRERGILPSLSLSLSLISFISLISLSLLQELVVPYNNLSVSNLGCQLALTYLRQFKWVNDRSLMLRVYSWCTFDYGLGCGMVPQVVSNCWWEPCCQMAV